MALQREVCLLPSAFFTKSLKQRKLEPPMSDWFSSIPHAMDIISYSVRVRGSFIHDQFRAKTFQFQQDMQASLIRFLRERVAEQRDVLLRVKHEREELKNLRKCVSSLVFLSWLIGASKGWSRSFGQRTNNCGYMRV